MSIELGKIVRVAVKLRLRSLGLTRIAKIVSNSIVIVKLTSTFHRACSVKDLLEDFAYVTLSDKTRLLEHIVLESSGKREFKRFGVFKFSV